MSEETNTTSTVSLPPKEVRDGVNLEPIAFREDSALNGFHFYSKSFDSIEAFRKNFSELGENADELLLDLANRAVAGMIRAKATAKVNDKDEFKARQDSGRFELVSLEEAFKYVPGAREAYSIASLNKKLNEITSSIKELKAAEVPDTEAIEKLRSEGREVFKKIQDAQAKQLAALE